MTKAKTLLRHSIEKDLRRIIADVVDVWIDDDIDYLVDLVESSDSREFDFRVALLEEKVIVRMCKTFKGLNQKNVYFNMINLFIRNYMFEKYEEHTWTDTEDYKAVREAINGDDKEEDKNDCQCADKCKKDGETPYNTFMRQMAAIGLKELCEPDHCSKNKECEIPEWEREECRKKMIKKAEDILKGNEPEKDSEVKKEEQPEAKEEEPKAEEEKKPEEKKQEGEEIHGIKGIIGGNMSLFDMLMLAGYLKSKIDSETDTLH
jgi:hypothetical protein